jgi:WD40 repeat protein
VWDITTGQPLVRLGGYKDWLFNAVFSPDSRYVVASGREGIAHIHDARTGRIVATMDNARAHASENAEIDPAYRDRPGISGTVFTADGSKILMSCSDGVLRIWDARSGRLLRSIYKGGGGDVVLSDDGALVALAHMDGTVGVLNTADFVERFQVGAASKEKETCGLVFSPDGRWLAIGS